ncbi:MAG: phospho-sugar mutase [Bacillus sp. (in: firmicutes)]
MAWKQRFHRWNIHNELDQELKDLLIEEDEQLLEDQFYRFLEFGTAGMRGELGPGTNRMNIYTVRRAAEGLALFMDKQGEQAKSRGVVIAYDNRHKSDIFAAEVAKTLGYHGVKVFLFESLRPTPELSFAIRYLGAFAGVMITASHNPAEYNGFKLYGEDGGQITPEASTEILDCIGSIACELSIPTESLEQMVREGSLVYIGKEVDEAYVNKVMNISLNSNIDKQVSIVYSPLHGTGSKLVKKVLGKMGFTNVTYVAEQMEADPSFSTIESPNPEEKAAFALAVKYGKKNNADLLMATDPDADRIGIAVRDSKGEYQILSGNQIGALITHYILSERQKKGTLPKDGVIIKSIVTNEMGRAIAEDFNIPTIDILTGFKYISEKIAQYDKTKEQHYLFGYEESYGYLIGDFARDKDAVQTALLLAEMAGYYHAEGKTLLDALHSLFEKYGYFRESLNSITLKGREGAEQINRIMTSFREDPSLLNSKIHIDFVEDYLSGKRTYTDKRAEESLELPCANVLKCICDDESWFCIRPSGTEPKIKLYFGVRTSSREKSDSRLRQLEKAVMEKFADIQAQ